MELGTAQGATDDCCFRDDLEVERGWAASADVTRVVSSFELTATGFASRISDPVMSADVSEDQFALLNAFEPQWVWAPLTPRHAFTFTAVRESETRGRIGVEAYYTGLQELDDDPYRQTSRRYLLIGVLAERRLGRMRLFVNAENLLNVRQTRYAPLVRPDRRADGRWTVDAWAPLDRVVVNGGMRLVLR